MPQGAMWLADFFAGTGPDLPGNIGEFKGQPREEIIESPVKRPPPQMEDQLKKVRRPNYLVLGQAFPLLNTPATRQGGGRGRPANACLIRLAISLYPGMCPGPGRHPRCMRCGRRGLASAMGPLQDF